MGEIQPTMTEQEAVEVLRKYILDTGKTQTAVAKELNISSGALSSFLKGTYKAPHTVVPKVQELLHLSEKKKVAPRKPDYVETGISRTVLNAIRYSHIQGQVSVVYGDAGIGKTMAFRRYLEENSLAVGITISPTYSSITGVNELLAEQIGVRERVARRITKEIVSKLRGSGRVIIIDEAQHLTTRTLNHLRCISDESGVGICLIGNLEVYTRMKGSGKADFAQLFSRIGMVDDDMDAKTRAEAARSIATLQRAQVSNEKLKIQARKEQGAVHIAMQLLQDKIFAELGEKYPDVAAKLMQLAEETEAEMQKVQ